MALTTTTLSSACSATDKQIVVTSATGFAAGYKVLVDGEEMEVGKDYVSGTTIPVYRGRGGAPQAAHVSGANATAGAGSDFQNPAPGSHSTTYSAIPVVYFTSVTATSTLTLPPPRSWSFITLNGTSAITLTIPVPTKDMDGTVLVIMSNGVAAHVPTFTSGLGGVGSGYTALTGATGARLSTMVVACNGYWNALCFPAWTGTVTKVTGGIA